MNKVGDSEALWTAMDVARYLRVSRSWVYGKAEAGLIPVLRVGGLLRFEPDAIRSYARREIPSPIDKLVANHGKR